MNPKRNTDILRSESDIKVAADAVAHLVRLLNLSLDELVKMYDADVISQLSALDEQRAVLVGYARGYRHALIDSIRINQCELAYRSSRGAYFGTTLPGHLPHVAKMSPSQRRQCTAGYVWLGSNIHFTEFEPETVMEGLV